MVMDLDDILERVTRAEEQVRQANEMHRERHSETLSFMKSVDERIGSLEQSLAKYTGFWGAIIMVVSAVGAALALFKEFLSHKLGMDA
jgi:hypothetical protein